MAAASDGQTLVVSGERSGVRSVWSVDMATGAVRDLGLPWSRSVAIAPAGDQVVVLPSGEGGVDPLFAPLQ
jgi:hypothetical protein